MHFEHASVERSAVPATRCGFDHGLRSRASLGGEGLWRMTERVSMEKNMVRGARAGEVDIKKQLDEDRRADV